MKYTQRKTPARRAFTLIEMMIVIGIIGLLAALTLGISSSVLRNSEIRRTKNVLTQLDVALQEWELDVGRAVTFQGYIPVINGIYDVPWDGGLDAPAWGGVGVDNNTMHDSMEFRILYTVLVLEQSEAAKDVLAKMPPSFFVNEGSGRLAVDAWGAPIGVVFPGRKYLDAYPLDNNQYTKDASNDLTLRDQAEDGLGSCINNRPYFVSAGPDGLWGYRFQANNGPVTPDDVLWSASLDNIYSYEPFIVEASR